MRVTLLFAVLLLIGCADCEPEQIHWDFTAPTSSVAPATEMVPREIPELAEEVQSKPLQNPIPKLTEPQLYQRPAQ